jgi:predicted metal-dependent phosphoesterase TrpH
VHAAPATRFADLHVHPAGNARDPGNPQEVYAALCASGLRVAVLADHDRIDVAAELVARSRGEGAPIELIIGEEVTTRQGHVVGIGLSSQVPPGMTLAATVAAIHGQGGLAVVAHPLLPPGLAASAPDLIALAEGDPIARPDALETMNPVAVWVPGWRSRVERLARRANYAMVGGSDAHLARSIGRGRTGFRGDGSSGLITAIRLRETWAEGRRSALREVFRARS